MATSSMSSAWTRRRATIWNIYRRGRTFTSPDGKEVLGVEQRYLGTAKVERFADVRSLDNACRKCVDVRIATRREIVIGDRLVPAPRGALMNYVAACARRRPIARPRSSRLDRDADRGRPRLDRHARQGREPTASTSAPCSRSTACVPPIPDPRDPVRAIADRREPTLFYHAGSLAQGARRAHRLAVRVPRLRPRLVRARAQHDRSGRRRRLRPQSRSAVRSARARRRRANPAASLA